MDDVSTRRRLRRGYAMQLCAVLSATTGSVADGMHYAWSSPILPILRSDESPVGPVTESDENLIEILYMVGSIAGLPITVFLVNKFGRKSAILISAIINIIVWLMLAFAPKVEVIHTARFLSGIIADMDFVTVPMYIAEIADKNIRGFLCGLIYIMMLLGIVILYSVAPFVTVFCSSLVGGGLVVIQITAFSFMPESPYYFLVKKKVDKGEKALRAFRGGIDVTEELKELMTAVERQEKERGRLIDLFIDKGNRKALLIMTVLNAAQHLSSISVMLMNLHTILADAEGILPPRYAGIIFAVVMLISSSITVLIVDKLGRRILMLFSCVLTVIALVVLSTYFVFKDYGYDMTTYSWVPVFAVLLYAFAFKCGMGLIPIVMTGELFPTSVKAVGMTFADAVYVIFGTISLVLYQQLYKFGMYTPFYLFSGCCVAAGLFVLFYMPETKGKTLEEIQFILKGTS